MTTELTAYLSSPVTWGKALFAFLILSALLAFVPMFDKPLAEESPEAVNLPPWQIVHESER